MPIDTSNKEALWQSWTKVQSDRAVVESTWEDIVYFTNPRKRGVVSAITPGQHIPSDVYDATATQSNITLAAGLAAFLTNPAQMWSELRARRAGKQIFDIDAEENIWLADVNDAVHMHLRESNFYQQIHEAYLDFGPFGTASLYEEEDEIEQIRFFARHPKEIYALQNSRGRIDTVFRYFDMTSYEAYDFFGKEALPEQIRRCVEEARDYVKMFKFLHIVAPRSKRVVGSKNSKDKPIASIWIAECTKDVIREGGFDEMPFFVARFYKNSQEVYGYGAGHAVYPDIRMLNDLSKVYYESAEVSIFPPSMVEHDSIVGSLDFRAKALNYQKQELSRGLAVQPLLNGANLQIGIDFLERVEAKVEKAFFVDLFLALRQTKRMTATEVLEISQERMFMLGPVLGRLQNELLTPLISRTINILARRGKLPQPPASLEGVEYEVVYVSPLARAQRAMQVRDMRSFMLAVSEMAAFAPDVIDNIDTDVAVRELSEMHSVSPKILNSDDEVDAIRKARQEQLAKQAMMATMQQGAQTARDAGSAAKDFAAATVPTGA